MAKGLVMQMRTRDVEDVGIGWFKTSSRRNQFKTRQTGAPSQKNNFTLDNFDAYDDDILKSHHGIKKKDSLVKFEQKNNGIKKNNGFSKLPKLKIKKYNPPSQKEDFALQVKRPTPKNQLHVLDNSPKSKSENQPHVSDDYSRTTKETKNELFQVENLHIKNDRDSFGNLSEGDSFEEI